MKATDIITKAKNEIRDFIVYELSLLYSAKGWQDDNYNAFGDMYFECETVSMDVWVTDCEGNDYQEMRKVERVVCTTDECFVELEDDREYYFSELDVYTLAGIANEIENEYKNAISK
jgi:hypothetical protein